MQRAITAIYPTHTGAAQVRDALERLGIPGGHVHMIPETEDRLPEGEHRNLDAYNPRLHDLHLPEDDMRTYQQAVRNGDYVVSVDVDEAERLDRIKAIMRDPGEARDLDALDREYSGAKYIPFRHEDRPAYSEDQRGIRDTPQPGERADVRGYTRAQHMTRPGV